MNTPTPSNNIDTILNSYLHDMNKYAVSDVMQDEVQAQAEEAIQNILLADHNKLIKHLAFYYGLTEAEMRKVAEGAK